MLIAGDHVPVIPLFDVVGKAAIAAPLHCAATAVKVGVTGVFTVINPDINNESCPNALITTNATS